MQAMGSCLTNKYAEGYPGKLEVVNDQCGNPTNAVDLAHEILQLRGGKGLLCYNVTEKTGNLVGMKLLDDGRDIMLITNEGILIRMSVDDISVIGRNTSGVKLMSIDADSNVRVASIAKVRESSRQDEEDENVEDPESEENEDGEITE